MVRYLTVLHLVPTTGEVAEEDFDRLAEALFDVEASSPALADADAEVKYSERTVSLSFTHKAPNYAEAQATAESVSRSVQGRAFGYRNDARQLPEVAAETSEYEYA